MRIILVSVSIFLFTLCTLAQEDTASAVQVSKDSIEIVLDKLCFPINCEFVDLYEPTAEIPENDRIKLKALLEDKGYKLVDIGRGNWDKGPRILAATLRKDDCECIVIKQYYSDYDGKLNQTLLKVTEVIKCRRIN